MANITGNSTLVYLDLVVIQFDKLLFSGLIVIVVFLCLAVIFTIMYLCKKPAHDDDNGWQVMDWHHNSFTSAPPMLDNVTMSTRVTSTVGNRDKGLRALKSLDYSQSGVETKHVSTAAPSGISRKTGLSHPLFRHDAFQHHQLNSLSDKPNENWVDFTSQLKRVELPLFPNVDGQKSTESTAAESKWNSVQEDPILVQGLGHSHCQQDRSDDSDDYVIPTQRQT